MNAKVACNPAQVYAIYIHLDGLLAHLIRIAMLFGFGSVLATAVHTADAL
jgi:hypothetical protein